MNDLKRLYLLCLTLFALISLLAHGSVVVQAQTAQDADYASVVQGGSGANIRSAASLSSEVLRAVPPGYPVIVLERQGDWFLIEDFLEKQGWIFASLLTEPLTVITKISGANLRSGPGLSEGIITELDYATVLSVMQKKGDWLQVSDSDGLNGWVHQDIIWPAAAMAGSGQEKTVVAESVPAQEVPVPPQPVEQIPAGPAKKPDNAEEQTQPAAVQKTQAETGRKEAAETAISARAEKVPSLHAPREHEYRIGPRDVVSVNIFAGGEKQIGEDVTVSADGQITLPLLGGVQAAGLTVAELRNNSIEPLALDYFVEPQITVTIKEYHSLSFYISGSVVNPGHYELDKAPTMLELIAKAGGLEKDYGHKAYILRESPLEAGSNPAKPIFVDMKALLDQGDMTNNLRLVTGDVIHIPRGAELNQASNAIFVEGEVKSPGVYTFQQGITALSACILAGGFNDYAAPNRARIIRRNGPEQEIIELNLDAVKKGKAKDVELQPGDLVHIPDSWL